MHEASEVRMGHVHPAPSCPVTLRSGVHGGAAPARGGAWGLVEAHEKAGRKEQKLRRADISASKRCAE